MKEISTILNPISFPNQLASDETKETPEYGLRVGQSIQYEWFKRDGGTCGYYSRWMDFNNRRLYARGEQSIQKYKKEIAVDGDLSYLNLDWTPVPIIPKFVDIVVNGMMDRMFHIKTYAQDALASDERSKHQRLIETDMISKDMLLSIEQNLGVDAFSTDKKELPETPEELQLHMQLKYKPAIEIAEEEGINTLLEENHYQDTQKRYNYDLVNLGMGVVKHNFLPGSGVQVDYVDPATFVWSYTEDPTFKDCFYFGEVKQIPLTEIIKIKPDISKDELKEISQLGSAWFNYYGLMRPYMNDVFNQDVVTLLYFNYKTTKSVVHKKKKMDNGGDKVIQKSQGFNPPEDSERFSKVEKRIDVWYDGVMVMGSNYLLKWELAKNMVRPKSASQRALSNYVPCAPRMYKGQIESLTKRMIPFADLIQMTHLKLQQVLARVVPDGVFIDADGLNEVDLGTGAAYNPEDALKLYFQTGSVIGRSFTQDGEYNHAKIPIQELGSSSGQQKMSALIGNYNHYLNMIRDVTGLNEARDASNPDPNSLVGVQKLAALNSNTATRHILDASLFITRRLAEGLSCRISDILEYSDFAEEFANQIGKYNVAILNDIKDLYLHDFGIFIEMSPDEEQKAQLEQNIQMALSKESISLEDAIDIREVKNLKMANELLKLKRKRKEEKDQAMAQALEEQKGKIKVQTEQELSQLKQQIIDLQKNADIELQNNETDNDIKKKREEADLKERLMQKEFDYNMQLRTVDSDNIKGREEMKETAKDKRISLNNTEQSQLIEQRQSKGKPKNFESNEDSLDGFDLAEFNPR
jgi:hypothetical protein